jgi:hypothetical protein
LTVVIINIPEDEYFQPEQHSFGDSSRNPLNTLPVYVLRIILLSSHNNNPTKNAFF